MNFRENMASLQILSVNYYQGSISFAEYREQRSQLLALIDEDLNGVKIIAKDEVEKEEEITSESLVDKALSFLKID